jgi:uncharacterized protein YlxW (UPF0749 family)
MTDLVERLRAEDPECGLRHSLAMEASDCIRFFQDHSYELSKKIEELENDLNLLRKQNREQRYQIERLKVPENERYPLGLAPIYVEKKDDNRD